MKIFIVTAHPESQSFSTALYHEAIKNLEAAGHEVKTSDLYEMNWNPVASADDFKNRKNPDYMVYALEQRHGFDTNSLADDIQGEIEKLKWCDMVIFNFPVFWYSMPAIMKGWIDRVFVSGFCYGGRRVYDQGGLAGKKALLTITLGGRDYMFDGDNSIHGPLPDMLRHILRGTLGYTGLEVLPPFIGWHIPYITQEDREQILVDYKDYLNNLDQLTPLEFPKTENFDKFFQPLKQPIDA